MSKYDNFIKSFNKFDTNKYDARKLFEDFIYLSAYAISNSVDKIRYKKREEKYLQIIKKYTVSEANLFAELLGELVNVFEVDAKHLEFDDILGNIYMLLGCANKSNGQFFTPITVSHVMASATLSKKDVIRTVKKKDM